MKKLAFWLMTAAGIGIFAWWLLTRAGAKQIQVILELLPGLSRPWLAASVMLQAVFFCWQSVLFRGIFQALGFSVPIERLLIIVLVSRLTGYVVPLGTAAAVAAFVAIARKDGVPAGASTMANSLFHLLNYVTFGLFVAYSLVFLRYTHRAHGAPGASAMPLTIMLVTVVALAAATSVAFRNPRIIASACKKAAKTAASGLCFHSRNSYCAANVRPQRHRGVRGILVDRSGADGSRQRCSRNSRPGLPCSDILAASACRASWPEVRIGRDTPLACRNRIA